MDPHTKKQLTIWGSIAGIALTLLTATIEAAYKPFAEFVVDNIRFWIADEWVGEYREPKPVSGHESRIAEDWDVSRLKPKENRTISTWKIVENGQTLHARYTEDEAKYEGSGYKGGDYIVLSYHGPSIGRGTIYLEQLNGSPLFFGRIIFVDCQSKEAPAAMICPYVLYKKSDSKAKELADNDPRIEAACQSILLGSTPSGLVKNNSLTVQPAFDKNAPRIDPSSSKEISAACGAKN